MDAADGLLDSRAESGNGRGNQGRPAIGKSLYKNDLQGLGDSPCQIDQQVSVNVQGDADGHVKPLITCSSSPPEREAGSSGSSSAAAAANSDSAPTGSSRSIWHVKAEAARAVRWPAPSGLCSSGPSRSTSTCATTTRATGRLWRGAFSAAHFLLTPAHSCGKAN